MTFFFLLRLIYKSPGFQIDYNLGVIYFSKIQYDMYR